MTVRHQDLSQHMNASLSQSEEVVSRCHITIFVIIRASKILHTCNCKFDTTHARNWGSFYVRHLSHVALYHLDLFVYLYQKVHESSI